MPLLFERLYAVLDKLGRGYEVIFINDGSQDRSADLLSAQFEQRPEHTRVINLYPNSGQHAALIAGFARIRGKGVVTLDADLQNPPGAIATIIAELDKGHDYVGSIRSTRADRLWRHWASRLMNILREHITNIHITDQGCMLRGYSRGIALAIAEAPESQTFVPALGYLCAQTPTEVLVEHDERAAGVSKYNLFRLVQLNFDLITSFSSLPLQFISLAGIVISLASLLFVLYLAWRRIFIGPEVEGVFTLLGIIIFLLGLMLFCIGIVGEYIGRINSQLRRRPRYRVVKILEADQPGIGCEVPTE